MPGETSAIDYELRDGVIVLKFQDVSLFDESVYDTLEDGIFQIIDQEADCSGVVLSLEGVKLVSTAVWGKLFVLSRKLRQEGHGMAFCSLGPLLSESVRALKLDRFIPIEEKLDGALKRVSG